jgi:hypothetical protein
LDQVHPDLIPFYESTFLETDPWDDDSKWRFVDYDLAAVEEEGPHLKAHVQECVTISQYPAFGSHSFILGEGREVCDPEQTEEKFSVCFKFGTITRTRQDRTPSYRFGVVIQQVLRVQGT